MPFEHSKFWMKVSVDRSEFHEYYVHVYDQVTLGATYNDPPGELHISLCQLKEFPREFICKQAKDLFPFVAVWLAEKRSKDKKFCFIHFWGAL